MAGWVVVRSWVIRRAIGGATQRSEEEAEEQSGHGEDDAAQAAPEPGEREEHEKHQDDDVEVVHFSAQCALGVHAWDIRAPSGVPASAAAGSGEDGQEPIDDHEGQHDQGKTGEQQFGLCVHARMVNDAPRGRYEKG